MLFQSLSEFASGNWITTDSKLMTMMVWLVAITGSWEPAQAFASHNTYANYY